MANQFPAPPPRPKARSRPQQRALGFTLIELISGIVILGILAAVLVPKYADMTSQAQKGMTMTAVSEGISRFNIAYAIYTMEKGAPPTALTDLNGVSTATGAAYLASGEIQTGDYTFTIVDGEGPIANSGGNGSVTITAWLTADTEGAGSAMAQTKTIPVNWQE